MGVYICGLTLFYLKLHVKIKKKKKKQKKDADPLIIKQSKSIDSRIIIWLLIYDLLKNWELITVSLNQ